jgi:hypothetical protein
MEKLKETPFDFFNYIIEDKEKCIINSNRKKKIKILNNNFNFLYYLLFILYSLFFFIYFVLFILYFIFLNRFHMFIFK